VSKVEVLATTELQAPPESVWPRVVSLQGINHELGPWMRMTAPRGAELSPENAPLGRRWFRSWILLLGVLPFDYDDLCVERIEHGRGFLERSRMLSASVWEHERTLEPFGERATRLTDRVCFAPRLPAAAALQKALIAAIFRHRHRRLQAFFGAARES
jgi:ligand-binding SRPBCC domain-containing protein